MRKKMLISLALVMIMLFNCIAPIMQVQATTTVEQITLNSALYKAVKSALTEQNVEFAHNDNELTIGISTIVLARITELSLNEKDISNLEGIEKFSNLISLDLSGNKLSEDSSLESLSALTKLNYLDLSTNNIADVTAINDLISTIEGNNGKVILTSQFVEQTYIYERDEDIEEVKVDLPLILEKAGYIKEDWVTEEGKPENESQEGYVYNGNHPFLIMRPDRINENNRAITVNVVNKGLFKYTIKISDTKTEASSAANLNPAATNPLKDSEFITYVVVHDKESTGIHIPDDNLYKEIKRQLTYGQEVNKELSTYPYKSDINNEIIYEKCTYEYVAEQNIALLTVVGQSAPKYVFYPELDAIYPIAGQGNPDSLPHERITIETVDENGNISYREGFKVAILTEQENLYEAAYDEPKVLVISDDDLMNRISSLILNNKEIRDLTGIEYFVGLKSDLNVSHNYLSNIDPIYELQENKEAYEGELQERFNGVLKNNEQNLNQKLSDTISSKEAADENVKNISDAVKEILNKFKEALSIKEYTITEETVTDAEGNTQTVTKRVENEKYEEELDAKANEIIEIINKINGYEKVDTVTGNREEIKGYRTLLTEALSNTSTNLQHVYSLLSDLYNVYQSEYKLLTLLTDEMNYLDLEEYTAYKETIKNRDEAKQILQSQISYVSGLNSNNTLTEFEKQLFTAATYGAITFGEDNNTFNEYFESNKENTAWLNRFREIALYSEMANYCLIKRMEEETASEYCYAEEYLLKRIKEHQLEGIDTSIEETVLMYIQQDAGDMLFEAYKTYRDETLDYAGTKVQKCSGQYNKVRALVPSIGDYLVSDEIIEAVRQLLEQEENTDGSDAQDDPKNWDNIEIIFTKLNGKSIISSIEIFEVIDENYDACSNDLYLYNEVIVLSKRLLDSNVERYVSLPDLKRLDISYNAYLEGMERLGELSYLRELQANANYITEIESINWENLEYLRKLGLAYNYITDITPLEILKHLVELDVSHNLLAGTFEFSFNNCQFTLRQLDISHNQLEDISRILEFLDIRTSGDFANYLAREDTMNMDIGYQDIVMELENPILLNKYPSTVDVDLPKIFVQLLAIDAERTSLGNTSLDGRIESEGRYATLNTNTAGDKVGVVEIIKMPNAETCVGIGTKATIKYKVGSIAVNSVTINENITKLEKDTTTAFTATVDADILSNPDNPVVWSVEGALSEGTTISLNGVLTIAADETATSIKVIATAVDDDTKKDEKTIEIITKAVTNIVINEQNTRVERGTTATYTATVTGDHLEDADKAFTWAISGTENAGTTINQEGVLTVAADEEAETITVSATSNFDNTKTATSTVTLFTKSVSGVNVTGNETAKPGETVSFTADVEGENLEDADKSVTWSLYGNTTPYTMINPTTGELKIAENENAEVLIIAATSKYDVSKVGTGELKLVIVRSVEVESTSDKLNNGSSMTLTAKVEGSNLTADDQKVTWTVTGGTATTTNITEAGVLTIGENETAEKVTVTATSQTNPAISGTKEIEIAIPLPQLGYELDENDETIIVGVSPSTTVSDFKAKLVTDNRYTVVVKRNGENVENTANVATGDMAIIYFGDTLVETFEIVVKGDANGDGLADALDSSLIKAHRARLTTLTGTFYKAADIDDNNEISVTDVRLLLYHRARIDGYIL